MSLKCPYNNGLQCSAQEREQEVLRQITDAGHLGEFKADFAGHIVAQCEKCWRLQKINNRQR